MIIFADSGAGVMDILVWAVVIFALVIVTAAAGAITGMGIYISNKLFNIKEDTLKENPKAYDETGGKD